MKQEKATECSKCKEYRILIGRIMAGDDPGITGEEAMACAGARMNAEWRNRALHGLDEWISRNWPVLCELKCRCGAFVSYDVLRRTRLLMCNECEVKKQQADMEHMTLSPRERMIVEELDKRRQHVAT